MVAAIAFPARYNYLFRIGALSLMPINALLTVDVPPSLRTPQPSRLNTGFEHDDLALHIRSPQTDCSTQTGRQEIRGQSQTWEAAGMEPGRSLFRYRRAGGGTRPSEDGRRMRRV